jgi:hypothetical protein
MEFQLTPKRERSTFSQPHPMSHPAQLAAVASLFGMQPKPVLLVA